MLKRRIIKMSNDDKYDRIYDTNELSLSSGCGRVARRGKKIKKKVMANWQFDCYGLSGKTSLSNSQRDKERDTVT